VKPLTAVPFYLLSPEEIMDKAFNYYCRTKTRFTPDIAELEEHMAHVFFACDSLMTGCRNHNMLQDGKFKGRAFTLNGFKFYQKRTDGTAIPMGGKDKPDLNFTRIKGEVHLVSSLMLCQLDTMMQNGVQFRRKRVEILYPYREHELVKIGDEEVLRDLPRGSITTKPEQGLRHYVSDERIVRLWAFMYVGVPNYWDDLIDAGFAFTQIPIKHSDKPGRYEYYQFNKRE